MNTIYSKLYNMISKKENISIQQLKGIVSPNNIAQAGQLLNVITALQSEQIEVNQINDNQLYISSGKIYGSVVTKLDENNFIQKVQILPKTPNICSVDELKSAFKFLGVQSDIAIGYNNSIISECKTLKKMAIASLVKVVIAAAVYREIELGRLSLEQEHLIGKNDLSFFSAGLRSDDIGHGLKIKDLLSLMLIASDNTATDILINLVGDERITSFMHWIAMKSNIQGESYSIATTKQIYGHAWGVKDPENYDVSSTIGNVKWYMGFDYFLPLSLVNVSMVYLLKQKWLPWNDLIVKRPVYKGGSAPGVLSGIWAEKVSGDIKTFSFTSNRHTEFSILEELYLYECARKMMRQLKIL